MKCFVNRVVRDRDVAADIRELIPDAGLRRRMSRVIRMAVATAVECAGGVDATAGLDAIITATGLGCLTDSERFLRNMIADGEELLNPTPFIQSTFNTVGGQIALLRRNHCYNVTYVNRSHSFEDALLDALLRCADGEAERLLVGAFDEQTPAQLRIMERMGIWRHAEAGEGAVFALLAAERSAESIAEVVRVDFPAEPLTEGEIRRRYASDDDTVVLADGWQRYGLWPTVSAMTFADAVGQIAAGAGEAVVYNAYMGGSPAVVVLRRCIGQQA